jgi:DNA-binding Lrp family transcriptional regulator
MQETQKVYVLVQAEGRVSRIAGRLRAVSGVVFAHDLTGPYDALALATIGGDEGALDRLVDAIRELPGVLRAIAAPLIPAELGAARVDAA